MDAATRLSIKLDACDDLLGTIAGGKKNVSSYGCRLVTVRQREMLEIATQVSQRLRTLLDEVPAELAPDLLALLDAVRWLASNSAPVGDTGRLRPLLRREMQAGAGAARQQLLALRTAWVARFEGTAPLAPAVS